MKSALRLVAHQVSIAVVGGDAITREGLIALLGQRGDFSIVASAADLGGSTLDGIAPQVVVVAAQHVGDSADLRSALSDATTRSRVVVTGASPEHHDLLALVNAGVAGFVMKDASFAELVATIRSVASGERVVPAALLDSIIRNVGRGRDDGRTSLLFNRMTPREREIVLLIANGKSNKEIADRTCITSHTVKTHVRNIMDKLGLHTRLQIAARANHEQWQELHDRTTRPEPMVHAAPPAAPVAASIPLSAIAPAPVPRPTPRFASLGQPAQPRPSAMPQPVQRMAAGRSR